MHSQYDSSLKTSQGGAESTCSGCSVCREDGYSRSVTMSVGSFDRQSFSTSDKDVQSLFNSKVWDDLGYTPASSPSPPISEMCRTSPEYSPECCGCIHNSLSPPPHGNISSRHGPHPPTHAYFGRSFVAHGYQYPRGVAGYDRVAHRQPQQWNYNGRDVYNSAGFSHSQYYNLEYPLEIPSGLPVSHTVASALHTSRTPEHRGYPFAPPPAAPLPPLPSPALPRSASEWGSPKMGGHSSSSSPTSARPTRSATVSMSNSLKREDEMSSAVPSEVDDVELPTFDSLMEQNLCKLAFRREGSMLLQKMLPKMNQYQKAIVLGELMGVLVSLSCNAYGNYVVQQLIDEATIDQRGEIAHVLGREIVALSMNIHGYCVVNKLIESVHVETQIALLECVQTHIKEMCLHEYASQVMICFIISMPPLFLHPVTTTFCGRSWFFATHSTSHRVLTTLIDRVTAIKRNELISEIANFVVQLSKDPVGNYVVQHILGSPAECGAISYIRMQLVENFYLLSLNKIASHVVEKLLQTSSRSELESAVEWVVNSSNKKLIKLINSPFGNYVMKTLTELASRGQRRRIAGRVEPITTRVRCSPFLKHLRELQVV